MPVLEETRKGNSQKYRGVEADARPSAPEPVTLRAHRPLRTWQERTAFYQGADVLEHEEGPWTEPALPPARQVRSCTTGKETLAPLPIPAAGSAPSLPKRQICPPRTTPVKRNFLQRHPVLSICIGVILFIVLYTAFFGGRLGLAYLGTHIRYGDHPAADSIMAEFPDHTSATIYASNIVTKTGRQLQVVILPTGDKATVLTLPLSFSDWGDVTQVVPSLSQKEAGAQLILTGDPSFWNFTCPIQESFTIKLVPGQGFHIDRV